jgi:hypothetical protein
MITNFRSLPYENLYESYSRFRNILENCPHRDFQPWLIIHTFYAGVSVKNRDILDLLTYGSFTDYGVDKAWELLEKMYKNDYVNEMREPDETLYYIFPNDIFSYSRPCPKKNLDR